MALFAMAFAQASAPAAAETWTITPSLATTLTATNNVDLAPSSSRQADLVAEISPSIQVNGTGARANIAGQVSVPVVLYARTGSENNKVYPSGRLLGNLELIDQFFFVEGEVSVTQQFFDPFGSQPPDLANATDNRYRTSAYRVSAWVQGTTPGYNVAYKLRNNNVWTNLSGAPIATDNAHYIQWLADASNANPAKFGWSAHGESMEIRFNDQRPIEMRLVRLKPIYSPDPDLQLWLNAGYEDNQFTLTENDGPIYGAGFEWRPTPRTRVFGNYEHRFFGDSYQFTFDHRTALSIWNVSATRGITSYPQQIATIPAGVSVAGVFDGLFLSRFADPIERQRAVDEFISDRGLPSVLSSPVALYTQQILLQDVATATAGLIGARNSVVFTVFYVRSEPIAGSGNPLPPQYAAGNDNTQTGASAAWSLRVTPSVSLTAIVQGTHTESNDTQDWSTRQGSARFVVSSPLSARTTAFAGARYQVFRSDISPDYDEAAVFIGLNHMFR